MFGMLRRLRGKHFGRPRAPRLNWVRADEHEGVLLFGDIRIHVCSRNTMAEKPSSAKDFVTLKSPRMVERMAALAEEINPKNIFEIGIFRGGSVVLYNEMFKPRKLVAVDIDTVRVPHLEEYLRSAVGGSNVSPHLGVDQANRTRLAEICVHEFGDEALDLAIDDASHFLFETRESFRALCPRLRPSGIYVIEDWAWAHWRSDFWQRDLGGDTFRSKEPVTNLILELLVLAASKPDWVSRVSIHSATVYVTRGSGQIPPGFDPTQYCLNRGKPLPRF